MGAWFEDGILGEAVKGCSRCEAAVEAIRATSRPAPYPDYGDPNEGLCMLGVVVDALAAIRDRLCVRPDVSVVDGHLAAADLTHPDLAAAGRGQLGSWRLQCTNSGGGTFEWSDSVEAVVIATGATPAPLPAWCAALKASPAPGGPRVVSGEIAVDAVQLEAAVVEGERVALLGTSHSAALVAMHLANRGWTTDNLTVYSPAPARQALWIPPGQYHFSATGLKGIASAFYADEVRRGEDSSPLLRHRDPAEMDDAGVRSTFDVIIPTIGYRTAALPQISVNGDVVDMHPTARDPATGQLMLRQRVSTADTDIFRPAQRLPPLDGDAATPMPESLPGLFGVGIGYPDYFELPVAPGERSAVGFGTDPDPDHGFDGENYVGFNSMILRSGFLARVLGD